MKKIGQAGLLGIAIFLVMSCAQGLFGGNLFAGLEGYEFPAVESANSKELVEAAEDNRFYEEVESLEPEKVEKMVETLTATAVDTAVIPIDRKKAALTASNVVIVKAKATEAVKTADDLITDLVIKELKKEEEDPGTGGDPGTKEESSLSLDEPGSIVQKLFKKDATLEEVQEQIEGLRGSADSFETYGELLKEDVEEGREPETPDGFNAGDVAAKALLAGTVKALLEDTKKQQAEERQEEAAESQSEEAKEQAAVEELAKTIIESLNAPESSETSEVVDAMKEQYGDSFQGQNLEKILGPDIYTVVNNGLDIEALINKEGQE